MSKSSLRGQKRKERSRERGKYTTLNHTLLTHVSLLHQRDVNRKGLHVKVDVNAIFSISVPWLFYMANNRDSPWPT